MRDIFTVAKFTIRDAVSRKAFRISTIVIILLIILGFNVPNFLSSIDSEGFGETILVVDRSQFFGESLAGLSTDTTDEVHYQISAANDAEITEQIMQGKADGALIISGTSDAPELHYVVKNLATSTGPSPILIDQLSALYTQQLLAEKYHLTTQQIMELTPNFTVSLEQAEETTVHGNIFVMMALSGILFFAIYFCAYQVSNSITVEKTSKIIETLVTSTSPKSIVIGKTIGIGLVGLGQIILFATTAIISAYSFLEPELLNALLDLSSLTPGLILIMIVYFLLGYFTYAFLYALTGSTVSKPEDIQSANAPIAIIAVIGFYLAYFTLMNPTGNLNLIAALLPISSPFCMPLRVMMGVANGGEICLSIAILVITCALIAYLAIKIYSNAILNYGTKPKLSTIIKDIKKH